MQDRSILIPHGVAPPPPLIRHMADEPPTKKARLNAVSDDMPIIPVELIVGPVACLLFLERDKTLLCLLRACRTCAGSIPASIMTTTLALRRTYPSAGLGRNVFRCALKAGRSADELEHIVAVFGDAAMVDIMAWVAEQSDGAILLRRLSPLSLARRGVFHNAVNAFEGRGDLLQVFFDAAFVHADRLSHLAQLVSNYGLPSWLRPCVPHVLGARRSVQVAVVVDRFEYFLYDASFEEFDWMVEHCPVIPYSLNIILHDPVPPRFLDILRRYPYAVLRHFQAPRWVIENPGAVAPVLCPLLFLDNPMVAEVIRGGCSGRIQHEHSSMRDVA